MKDTSKYNSKECPACRAEVLFTEKWKIPICPMCFIRGAEFYWKGMWRCGEDRIDFPQYPDHVWFYVVHTVSGVFIMNKVTYKTANFGIPIRYVYQGLLEDCRNFIRMNYEKKEQSGDAPNDPQ